MGAYHRLTLADRYQIFCYKQRGLGIREIANLIGKSASTVSRELRRNTQFDSGEYSPDEAQNKAIGRRIGLGPPLKISTLKERVEALLRLQWSPEQISGRLRKDGITISYETIYRHVYTDRQLGGDLYCNLRRRRRYRRSRNMTANFKKLGVRRNQNWIDSRPQIIEKRIRIGDFERDLMLGKSSRILTIVDRVSRLTKIGKIMQHNSHQTHFETIRLLSGQTVHSITNDNGPEFALHGLTEKELGTKIYFSRPYSSWQRGTNENTNGLIRQYFPRGTDFSKVSDERIKEVEDLLNQRPRKCLGYLTPFEVHQT